jgi:hypothetical protein
MIIAKIGTQIAGLVPVRGVRKSRRLGQGYCLAIPGHYCLIV